MSKTVYLPTGFYQATLRYQGAALPHGASVVWGGKIPSTGTPTPSTVGTAIKTALTASGSIYEAGTGWTTSVTLQDILVKFGPLDIGPSAITPVGLVIGSNAGDAISPNTALLVTKTTALGGHIGKGRSFMPGLGEPDVQTGGTIGTTALNNFQGKFTSLLGKLVTADINMYLLHAYDPDKGETPRAPTEVTALTLSSLVATQRDRLRR